MFWSRNGNANSLDNSEAWSTIAQSGKEDDPIPNKSEGREGSTNGIIEKPAGRMQNNRNRA